MTTEIGLASVVWETIGDSEIIMDNIRETFSGELDELTTETGAIEAAVFHGDKGEVTMDFIVKDGSATSYLSTRGSTITVPTGETDIASGQTLYLVSWEKGKEKNGWMSGTLTANYYPDLS